MGKRKERRLAALSNAGRRVKLDLFAEPSGDLGGSSVREEVELEGDSDVTQRTGLPNSPSSSSSGQQPQNPLLLLGQYSDDELDEESNKVPKDAAANNSTTDQDKQEKALFEGKDVDISEIENADSHKVERVDDVRNFASVDVSTIVEGVNKGDTDAAPSADKSKELGSSEHLPVDGTSNSQVVGDVTLGWKVVMHEESNQYYYWNTETGETSWEVPAVLAQSVQFSSDQRMIATDNVEPAAVGTHDSSSLGVELVKSSDGLVLDGTVDTDLVPQSQELHANGQITDGDFQGDKNKLWNVKNYSTDEHHTVVEKSLCAADAFPDGRSLTVSGNINDAVAPDEHEKGIDLWTELIKQCECLLERMRSLKGYEGHLQYNNRMWKYILEVEIRLTDIQTLSSYGSSLLPFWAHSKTQLNQLEDTINNEIYQLAVSAQMEDDIQVATSDSLEEREKSQETAGREFEADGPENTRKSEYSPVSAHVENDLQSEGAQGTILSSGSPTRLVEGEATVGEFHDVEDVDMEVDMEDEDGVPAPDVGAGDFLSSKVWTAQPNGHAGSLASGDASTAPPPPEEEWIPPPPPDNDPVPPPPPDNEHVPPPPPGEPPETSYPSVPSYTGTGQPIPYAEQYSLAYSDSNYQYYGATVTIPNSNFYGHADGSQLAVPHAPVYYEAVPNTYAETAPVMVGTVEPIAYYDLHGGSVPSVPFASSVESSHLHAENVPVRHHALTFGQSTTVNEPLEAASKGKPDVSAGNSESNLASVGVASSLTTTQTPATDVKESGSTSSTTNVTATATVTAPSTGGKVQSKVLRSKKRTVALAPSLRSNKKVSTLVDKWKAAKEELNEDEEDEPDNPYEILERKRQREIEEWHAKQIASGEAKDNANFQPLGGDWRERVKRRRAQAAKEAAKTLAETPPKDDNQEPDLIELSKGLPSGWQAYWDGSTKQVYYGNTMTSETTWDRPTK